MFFPFSSAPRRIWTNKLELFLRRLIKLSAGFRGGRVTKVGRMGDFFKNEARVAVDTLSTFDFNYGKWSRSIAAGHSDDIPLFNDT